MKKILIVEDNEDNMSVVEDFLEDEFELLKATDGVMALEMIAEKGPDLVLLDISLPQMDGIEVITKIRADESMKNLPVIALTAHAMIGDREIFLEYGFNDYMSKPITDDDLLIEMINGLIDE